ncbi:hypothetical protein AKJ55_01065, partial [candidate division MSBL1 archaeon SCGC-AAA382M17]
MGFHVSQASEAVALYTPYTKISVPPGETINYTIDLINKSSAIKNVEISLVGFPKEWHYDIKSEGWNISRLAVLPDEEVPEDNDEVIKIALDDSFVNLSQYFYESIHLT